MGRGGSKLEHTLINSIISQTSQSLLNGDNGVVALWAAGYLNLGRWQ